MKIEEVMLQEKANICESSAASVKYHFSSSLAV